MVLVWFPQLVNSAKDKPITQCFQKHNAKQVIHDTKPLTSTPLPSQHLYIWPWPLTPRPWKSNQFVSWTY